MSKKNNRQNTQNTNHSGMEDNGMQSGTQNNAQNNAQNNGQSGTHTPSPQDCDEKHSHKNSSMRDSDYQG
jgi:hypothetical protein